LELVQIELDVKRMKRAKVAVRLWIKSKRFACDAETRGSVAREARLDTPGNIHPDEPSADG
jgi:hypothetical protein